MNITTHVRPNAHKNEILEGEDGVLIVRVTATPEDGKANQAVIKLLAKHLGVPKSHITLKLGSKNKTKVFEITEKD